MAAHVIRPHRRILLLQVCIDRSTFRRKLKGIGQNVDQHLVQPYAVTMYLLSPAIADKDIKVLILGFYLGLHNIDNIFHGIPEGNLLII